MVGKRVAHYEVLKEIGKGGMGEVYLARDTISKRQVALKFLPRDLQNNKVARQRFLREAEATRAIDHPHICKIYEAGQAQGRDFLAMEFVSGPTLEERLKKERLPFGEALQIALKLGRVLVAAHQAGIVHRDLKPGNVMLPPTGGIKVMDFGLAKQLFPEGSDSASASLTLDGSTVGTLTYMSPEQVRCQPLDARSDLFSFGVVLYEMLAGVHPFKRPSALQTAHQILNESPPLLEGQDEAVFEGLNEILQKLLQKKPVTRYQQASEVVEDLQNWSRNFSQSGQIPVPSSGLYIPTAGSGVQTSAETDSGQGAEDSAGSRQQTLIALALAAGLLFLIAVMALWLRPG